MAKSTAEQFFIPKEIWQKMQQRAGAELTARNAERKKRLSDKRNPPNPNQLELKRNG